MLRCCIAVAALFLGVLGMGLMEVRGEGQATTGDTATTLKSALPEVGASSLPATTMGSGMGVGGDINLATALVKSVDGKGLGSAVCVDKAGLFVVSVGALAGMGVGSEVLLDLRSEGKETEIGGWVVRLDGDLGLALLMAKKEGNFEAMALGDAGMLGENSALTIYSYSLKGGGDLSGMTNHVTWVKSAGGMVRAFGVQWPLGDMGGCGPAVDGGGMVVGIADAGLGQVIGSGVVGTLMGEPVVWTGGKIRLTGEEATRPYEMLVRVVGGGPTTAPAEVNVVVDPDGKEEEVAARRMAEGDYVAELPAPGMLVRARDLRVNVVFESGSVEGVVKDRGFKVGGVGHRLSEAALFTRQGDSTFRVDMQDGKQATGAVEMDVMDCVAGGITCKVDMGKVVSMRVTGGVVDAPWYVTMEAPVDKAAATQGAAEGGDVEGRVIAENLALGSEEKVPDAPDLSPEGDWSIAVDFIPDKMPNRATIMNKSGVKGLYGGQWALICNANGVIRFEMRKDTNSNACVLLSNQGVKKGEKTTIVLAHKLSERRWTMYVTGQAPVTGTYTSYHWDWDKGPITVEDAGLVNFVWVVQRTVSADEANGIMAMGLAGLKGGDGGAATMPVAGAAGGEPVVEGPVAAGGDERLGGVEYVDYVVNVDENGKRISLKGEIEIDRGVAKGTGSAP